MKAQRVRETFLQYFADRGHRIVRSSPLLPKDDPTILFTNAGMNQFKNVFLGLEKRGYNRAATVQKCMRVSGKHNDLETVGRTAKHHTFFEMLGNFSFGDYFKKEAVAYAWDLVTRVFGLPAERLYATVYLDDDEAYRLWAGEVGVPKDRIFRYGKKDNFWAMGDTGPCGPCSELHYDLGAAIEPGDPFSLIEKGSDRFVELWNLVFMEFDQGEDGVMRPLPSPSIDTGMGLERMTAVVQGKRSNYDTDLFLPLIESAAGMARREYPAGDEGDVSLRIIADHVRAATFLIGDGVSPANDGRGYVLRRLIRRAFRQGNLVGIDRPFLFELVGRVADIMKDAYPELLTSAAYISKVCLAEEERFAYTLASGLRYFDQVVRETREKGDTVLPGGQIFRLYDTFGFPLDLSQELAREKALVGRRGRFRPGARGAEAAGPPVVEGRGQAEREADLRRVQGPQGPDPGPRSRRARGRARPRAPQGRAPDGGPRCGRIRRDHPRGDALLRRSRRPGRGHGHAQGPEVLRAGREHVVRHSRRRRPRRQGPGRRGPRRRPRRRRARSRPAAGDVEQSHRDPPPPRGPAPGAGRPRQAVRLSRLAVPPAVRFHPLRPPDPRGAPARRGDRQRPDPGRHASRDPGDDARGGHPRGGHGHLRGEVRGDRPGRRHRRLQQGALRRRPRPRHGRAGPVQDRLRGERRRGHAPHRGRDRRRGHPLRP